MKIHRHCKTLTTLQTRVVFKLATHSICMCYLCNRWRASTQDRHSNSDKEALAGAEQSLFRMDIPVCTLRHETGLHNVRAADYGRRQIMEENENHICYDN